MSRLHTGCAALLALAFVAACGRDSNRTDVAGPGSSSAGFSSNSGNGGGGDANNDRGDGDNDGNKTIAIRDDCDPRDPAYDPSGGCKLRRGDVTFAEFLGELDSPLAAAVVGHQAWRNDPSYLKIESGKRVRVRNEGGRAHTFTKVANFGGGKIPLPALNEGLVTAPECPGSIDIAPGGRTEVSGLAVGNHRFQCCIHPWMRALIKVKAHADHGDGD